MPMIDVYATAGAFTDKHQLAADLAATLMAIEGVPDIPMFPPGTSRLHPRAARRAACPTSTARRTTFACRCWRDTRALSTATSRSRS